MDYTNYNKFNSINNSSKNIDSTESIDNSDIKLIDLICLNKDSNLPVYQQLVDKIKELILNLKIKNNIKFPTERQLANKLLISRATVSKAYEILKQNGYIKSIQGSGYYINENNPQLFLSKKEKALYLLNKTYDDLISMGYSYFEIRNLLLILLDRKENFDNEIKIAFIDCNPEALNIIEKQLLKTFKINISLYLINPSIIDYNKSLNNIYKSNAIKLSNYDLILTTMSHYEFLKNLLRKYNQKLFKLSVLPDPETIIKLGSIKPGEKILILSTSKRFKEIIEFYLTKFGLKNHYVSIILHDESGFLKNEINKSKDQNEKYKNKINCSEELFLSLDEYYKDLYFDQDKKSKLQMILKDFNHIIIPPEEEFSKNEILSKLYYENQMNNRWIFFQYKIDNGSIMALEEKIELLKIEKIKELANDL